MPAGRAKRPAKAPQAPVDEALCPELEDIQGEGMSGPEDSPGMVLLEGTQALENVC